MFAGAVAAIALLIVLMAGDITSTVQGQYRMYQTRSRQIMVVKLAENISQYTVENSAPPASLAVLNAAPGFEQTKGMMDNWFTYSVSPAIVDPVWQFSRAVLFSNSPLTGVTAANYLLTNNCGVGSATVATGWCGTKTSQWYRVETKEKYNEQIMTQRKKLNRLGQKLADYYNSGNVLYNSFPYNDQFSVALAANSMHKVSSLAGYAGAANACNGTFTYMGIPIDCDDMFDLWGNPVGYQYISKTHILLVTEPPIFNAAGNRITVTLDADYTLVP